MAVEIMQNNFDIQNEGIKFVVREIANELQKSFISAIADETIYRKNADEVSHFDTKELGVHGESHRRINADTITLVIKDILIS